MFNQQVDAVLTILALSIFADKRVFPDEITAFVESADLINQKVYSNLEITEAKLLLWFQLNRDDIQSKMNLSSMEFKSWLESVLSEISALTDKVFISDIVNRIAHSDGELHISEKALEVILERWTNGTLRAA